jgi:hypothetical protein
VINWVKSWVRLEGERMKNPENENITQFSLKGSWNYNVDKNRWFLGVVELEYVPAINYLLSACLLVLKDDYVFRLLKLLNHDCLSKLMILNDCSTKKNYELNV